MSRYRQYWFASLFVIAQFVMAWAHAADNDASCCGSISNAGQVLLAKLDASGVDHLWIAGQHVDWKTGQPNSDAEDHGHGNASHCSAFAAAFAEGLGIYMLRPPEHSQILLASAQVEWLDSDAARASGWHKVEGMREAQTLANRGRFVVVAFHSPDPKTPGHIAIVRPAELSEETLLAQGPQITQAGRKNFLSTNVREGFHLHPGAWPDGVVYYEFMQSGSKD